MTSAEYAAKLGTPPPASPAAPVRMTQAEFNAKYGAKKRSVDYAYHGPNTGPSIPEVVGGAFKGGVEQAKEGAAQIKTAKNPAEAVVGALKAGAGASQALTSPLAPLFAPVSKAIEKVGDAVGTVPAVQRFANSEPGEATRQIAEGVANAGVIAGTALGGRSILKEAPSVARSASSVLRPAANDRAIIDSFHKAVKPTIASKNTVEQNNAYNAKAAQAVKTIASNKDSLSFTTEDGAVETGRLPQSRAEMAEAIDQTKKTIYQQYDALAQKAGQQGAKLDTATIQKDLDAVITNEALQLSHPEAVKYAQDIKARYAAAKLPDGSPMGTRVVDTKTAQQVIENYNAELKAFYRNPTYNQFSKVAIDATIVKNLRAELDRVISGATGEQYQTLRNQYAALKAIEADVLKSSNRAARLNSKSLIDYTDIFSGGDIVHGLVSLNPALFAKGVAQKGISSYFKYLNDPDRAIGQMFGSAERQLQSQRQSTLIKPATSKTTTTNSTPTKTNDNTSSHMPESLPQDGSLRTLLKRVQTEAKRGFAKNPLAPEKQTPRSPAPKSSSSSKPSTADIHPDDLHLMEKFIDHARVKGALSDSEFAQAEKLAQHFGISMDKGLKGVANEFEKVLLGSRKVKGTVQQQRDAKGRFK